MDSPHPTTNAPRTGNDAQTAFSLAVRLADQITSLDMDSATKERVAATRLIQAAIEGRDRMHNERHAALVAALESAKFALETGHTDLDSCVCTGINDTLRNVIRAALADARNI